MPKQNPYGPPKTGLFSHDFAARWPTSPRRPGAFTFEQPDRPFRFSGRRGIAGVLPGIAPGPDLSFYGGPPAAPVGIPAPPVAAQAATLPVPALPVTELAEAVLGQPKRRERGSVASRRRPVLLG